MVMGRRRGCRFHSSSASTWLSWTWGLDDGMCTSSWLGGGLRHNRHYRRIDDFSCVSWGRSRPELVQR